MIGRACIFLLLGAIVNIAVAWGCSHWIDIQSRRMLELQGASRWGEPVVWWRVSVRESTAASRVRSDWQLWDGTDVRAQFEAEELLPAWAIAAPPSGSALDRHTYIQITDARGWPSLSMWSAIRYDTDLAYRRQTDVRKWHATQQIVKGVESPFHPLPDPNKPNLAGTLNPRLLPVVPIWPGFAINTLFYAAILWLLFAAPFTLRRKRRIKRGLCPACAYPVGASNLCTECGNKLNITSKIARERMGLPPPATPAPGLMEAERQT